MQTAAMRSRPMPVSMEVKVDGEMKHISSFQAFVVALASRIGLATEGTIKSAQEVKEAFLDLKKNHNIKSLARGFEQDSSWPYRVG